MNHNLDYVTVRSGAATKWKSDALKVLTVPSVQKGQLGDPRMKRCELHLRTLFLWRLYVIFIE